MVKVHSKDTVLRSTKDYLSSCVTRPYSLDSMCATEADRISSVTKSERNR